MEEDKHEAGNFVLLNCSSLQEEADVADERPDLSSTNLPLGNTYGQGASHPDATDFATYDVAPDYLYTPRPPNLSLGEFSVPQHGTACLFLNRKTARQRLLGPAI
jgi:hypothetical protein